MPKRKKHKGGKSRGGKMPPKVLAYFKFRNAGLSKSQAKKRAGL